MKKYLIAVLLSLAAICVPAGVGLSLLPGLQSDGQGKAVRGNDHLMVSCSSTCARKMVRSSPCSPRKAPTCPGASAWLPHEH